ncbi:large subunit GTPase 1 homolog [Clavelina lepadiformis]|uniref:large subunit GTPase 1 homolog n=1 Tax=Clavelina lepadiformis TaxID=159417 RepID=UPI004040F725
MPRKKHQAPGLGKSLIKDRFGNSKNVAHKHAAELAAEQEGDELNLKSVTELTSLDDFLATAELAGTEFTAQKLNVHFVDSEKQGVISKEEEQRLAEVHEEFAHLISIPRRPPWDENMTKEVLDTKEKESFLSWRRQLAKLQEDEDLLITPYEKNLDFWRQLWRVIERSDVVVQIVDARDPLLFRCKDMETYVKEVSSEKKNVILVNKADLLSPKQRETWRKYFEDLGVEVVFWSAILENEKLELANKDLETSSKDSEDRKKKFDPFNIEDDDDDDASSSSESDGDVIDDVTTTCNKTDNSEDGLLTRNEMITYLKNLVHGKSSKVVGMVGYPNVGKSSTVNTLLGVKKAAVSATPGRTKHFQTLHIDKELCLCDCPGLVFPSLVSSKAEMVLSGILPIDQMRDHVGPANLLCRRINRKVVEGTYGINIAKPKEGEDPNRAPKSSEMLSAHALSRGFMTSHGQPDNSRSARVVLKDYVNGKLLYSRAPPGTDKEEYESWTISKVSMVLSAMKNSLTVSDDLAPLVARINRVNKESVDEIHQVEREFFKPRNIRTFTKSGEVGDTKSNKKHHKKRKEKMRRVRQVQY